MGDLVISVNEIDTRDVDYVREEMNEVWRLKLAVMRVVMLDDKVKNRIGRVDYSLKFESAYRLQLSRGGYDNQWGVMFDGAHGVVISIFESGIVGKRNQDIRDRRLLGDPAAQDEEIVEIGDIIWRVNGKEWIDDMFFEFCGSKTADIEFRRGFVEEQMEDDSIMKRRPFRFTLHRDNIETSWGFSIDESYGYIFDVVQDSILDKYNDAQEERELKVYSGDLILAGNSTMFADANYHETLSQAKTVEFLILPSGLDELLEVVKSNEGVRHLPAQIWNIDASRPPSRV